MFFTNYEVWGSIYCQNKISKNIGKSKAYSLGKMTYFLLKFLLSNVSLNVKNKTKTNNNPCFLPNMTFRGQYIFEQKSSKKIGKSKAYSLGKMTYFLLKFLLSNVSLNVINKTKTHNNPCFLQIKTFGDPYIFKRKSQKKFKKAKIIALLKKKYFFLNFSLSNVSLNVKNKQKTHNNPCFLTIMTFGGQYIFEIKSLKKLEKAKPIALVK